MVWLLPTVVLEPEKQKSRRWCRMLPVQCIIRVPLQGPLEQQQNKDATITSSHSHTMLRLLKLGAGIEVSMAGLKDNGNPVPREL
jgi:hypothetical protein